MRIQRTAAIMLFFYLFLSFREIFGIPTLQEFLRLQSFNETMFHPILNWMPFRDGLDFSYFLNILVFIPIGFLLPFVSKSYRKLTRAALLGFCISLLIETSQLFTLYRVSDIDDLSSNFIGTILGWCCCRLILKLTGSKSTRFEDQKKQASWIMPIVITLAAFMLAFFS